MKQTIDHLFKEEIIMVDVLFWLTIELCLCGILAGYEGIKICNKMIVIKKRIRMFERLETMMKAED